MVNGFSREELAKLMWGKPCFAQIELTRNCNFSCKFCFENCDYTEKYEDKSYKEWIKVIDQLYDLGVKKFHFSGGENSLYKYYEDILRYSHNKGFEILVNTNGYFNIEKVLKYVDEFVFSVHGYKNVHDKIVNFKGAFDKVDKNIEIAVKNGKTVSVNTVLIKDNIDNYKTLFEYLYSKYKNKIKYSPTLAIPCKTGKNIENTKLNINKSNFKKYLDLLAMVGEDNLIYKHGLHGLCHLEENDKEFYMPVCAAGKSKLIIKYNGDVYPCNFFQTKEYLCGNVFKDDVENIWLNGSGFNLFRDYYIRDELPDKCNDCKKKIHCFSGCKAWTDSYINGDIKIKRERDVRCELINAFAGIRNNNKM